MDLNNMLSFARKASTSIALASTDLKNKALENISRALVDNADKIIESNKTDLENAKNNGISDAMLDRLTLSYDRINAISKSIEKVIKLEDPIGKGQQTVRCDGLEINKIKVPLGVVGIIYEARPNVTVDAACICIKSGNAAFLRGGKEAINTNLCLCRIIQDALESTGLDRNSVQVVSDTSRQSASDMMNAVGKIDVLIPRGGKGLIQSIVENAKVPVIETGAGNCHVYVDEDADIEKAVNISFNAKAQRPSVCNAAETVLVHKSVAKEFLPRMKNIMDTKNVQLRGCGRTLEILPNIEKATDEDFYTEYNDYILAVKVVDSVQDAVIHINEHNTKHSEAIVTENKENAKFFTDTVDAAAVYVNASTRFTDGEEFGLGAEIGISTQKLHARGPMGLEALTTTKYVVKGDGHIRQ